MELMRRKGRGIALTDAGARLNVLARECLAALLDFKHECQAQAVEAAVGAGESVIRWLLLPRLEQIRARAPHVRLRLLNLPTNEAVKRLGDGLIDFAVVRKDAVARPLRAKSLGVMTYALFIPRTLRGVRNQTKGLKVLDGLPLATLEGEGTFRSTLSALARKHGARLNVQVECPSFPLAARAAAEAKVAAILPVIAAADLETAGFGQVAFPFLKGLDRELCLASSPRLMRIRPALESLVAVLSEVCRF